MIRGGVVSRPVNSDIKENLLGFVFTNFIDEFAPFLLPVFFIPVIGLWYWTTKQNSKAKIESLQRIKHILQNEF